MDMPVEIYGIGCSERLVKTQTSAENYGVECGERLVKTFIDTFEFDNSPCWKCVPTIDVENRVADIVEKLKAIQHKLNESAPDIMWKSFIINLAKNENIGVKTDKELEALLKLLHCSSSDSLSEKEKETKGVHDGIKFIKKQYKDMNKSVNDNEYQNEPALTEQSISDLHATVMSPVDPSIAGKLSVNERKTCHTQTGNSQSYPSPEFVKEHLPGLIDDVYYMTLYFHNAIRNEGISECLVKRLMKFFAYFFHCFVSLHPYSDGNGRTARLLVCFLHNLISPLPLSVYNWFSPSTREDYLRSLDNARTPFLEKEGMFSRFVKPSELATMILCCEQGVLQEYHRLVCAEN